MKKGTQFIFFLNFTSIIVVYIICLTFIIFPVNPALAATDEEKLTAALELLEWARAEEQINAILNPIVETEPQRMAVLLALEEIFYISEEILFGDPQRPGSYQDEYYITVLTLLYGTDGTGTDGDFAQALNLSPGLTPAERAIHESFLEWFVLVANTTIDAASMPSLQNRISYANRIRNWLFNDLAKMNMITQVGPDYSTLDGYQPKYVGSRPEMCADGNGNVYVVYRSNRDANDDITMGVSKVFFNYSRDYGKTWQVTDVPISTSANVFNWLEIACDDSGHVYVVWSGGGMYFNYSNNYGATWNTDRKLDVNMPPLGSADAVGPPEKPKVYCDNNGNVYAIWTYIWTFTDDDRREVYYEVYFSASYDYDAQNWQVPQRLDSPAQAASAGNGRLACDSLGNVYAVWSREFPVDDDRIYFKYSNDNGVTWHGDGTINPDMSESAIILDNTDTAPYVPKSYPEIACDENGNVYVAWHQRPDPEEIYIYHVRINYSNDHGVTWHDDKKIDTQVLETYYFPKLAATNDGHIYVSCSYTGFRIGWNGLQGGLLPEHEQKEGVYVNYSDNAGLTFQPEWTRLDSPDPAYEYYSAFQTIHAADNGSVYVSWLDNYKLFWTPTANIYYNYSIDFGKTWLNEPNAINISESFTYIDGSYVAVTSDNAGHMYITWEGIGLVWFFRQGVLEIVLDVNAQGHGLGTVALNPPDGVYNPGTVVTLTANADTNCFFTEWTGGINSTLNPDTITMDADKTVFANFALYSDVDDNGNVLASDALLALKHSVGISDNPILPLTGNNLKAADVDNNPGISAQDALVILKYSVGIITELPEPEG